MAIKKAISIFDAEREVRSLMEGDRIEDRLYEMALELADGYIKKVDDRCVVLDADGNICDDDGGEMWYDEVKDEVVRGILERVADFCRA
jgi:hypothetical protein